MLKRYIIYYLILGFENPAFAKIGDAFEKIKKIKKNSYGNEIQNFLAIRMSFSNKDSKFIINPTSL